MNRNTTPWLGQILSTAILTTFIIGGQQLQGQSVTPPKSPKVLYLEAQLAEQLDKKQKTETSLESVHDYDKVLKRQIAELDQIGSKMNLSAESYPEVLKTLHSQRVQLTIDLAGIDARYRAIEKAVGEVSKQQADSLIKPLEKLVELQTSELERMKMLKENGLTDSVRAAEIALLEAKSRLAQASSTSSGALAHLNLQLLDTSLDQAEKTARLEKTSSLIAETDEYREHASKHLQKTREVQSNDSKLYAFQNTLAQLEKNIDRLKLELEHEQAPKLP